MNIKLESETYFYRILSLACKMKCSDVHLSMDNPPFFRLNGELKKINNFTYIKIQDITNLLDIILDDIKKDTLYKNKNLDLSFCIENLGRFRANIYYCNGNFKFAIRILPFEIPNISSLGLPKIVYDFIDKKKGLFLVTGATGSGKSTTLASILNEINDKHNYHIITIENPIEYVHNNKNSLFTQLEVGRDVLNFENALSSALRQDPDVIMIGEMRDVQTISIALTAAETGHLVLSTMHTINAIKSIDRIIDSFDAKQQNQIRNQLSTTLEGIISQQLIQSKDKNRMILATEILVSTPSIQNLIREGNQYQINSIIQTSQNKGMHSMETDLQRLALLNLI